MNSIANHFMITSQGLSVSWLVMCFIIVGFYIKLWCVKRSK